VFRASAFRLRMFEQCPLRYKFHYVDDLARTYTKPRPYYTMGDHVHAALKDLLSSVPVEERTGARLEDLLREKWRRYRKGFADREEERQWGERALEQLRQFAASQDLSVTPLMVEDYHSTELSPKVTLVGRIDRVDLEPGGGLHIIDYKTGRTPSDIDSNQLHIYALILSRTRDEPVARASYLYLDAGELQTLYPTEADLDEAAEYVIVSVDRILAEREYPPVARDHCKTCDFLEICPSGKEAVALAAAATAEAGLPTEHGVSDGR
jgi:putative RecB family exonuclease